MSPGSNTGAYSEEKHFPRLKQSPSIWSIVADTHPYLSTKVKTAEHSIFRWRTIIWPKRLPRNFWSPPPSYWRLRKHFGPSKCSAASPQLTDQSTAFQRRLCTCVSLPELAELTLCPKNIIHRAEPTSFSMASSIETWWASNVCRSYLKPYDSRLCGSHYVDTTLPLRTVGKGFHNEAGYQDISGGT